MQGKWLIGLIGAVAIPTAPAMASDAIKRINCPKAEQSQQAQTRLQQQQQRARQQSECRANRTIPWVIDPTPLFLL
jgi:hypothetical protein